MKVQNILLAVLAFVSMLTPLQARVVLDVSNDYEYSKVIGRNLKTTEDLVIYCFKRNRRHLNISRIGSGSDLPTMSEMKPTFPFKHYAVIVLGILPSGSTLEVVKITEEGPRRSTFTHYYVKITSSPDSAWIGQIADFDMITNDSPPGFDPDVIEEVSR